MTPRPADAHVVLTFPLNDTNFAATGSDRK